MTRVLLIALVACGDGRADVDPTPYYTDCSTKTCPTPYECTTAMVFSNGPAPEVCFLPCPGGDDDCPTGFFCNGDTHGAADLGPPSGFCFKPD